VHVTKTAHNTWFVAPRYTTYWTCPLQESKTELILFLEKVCVCVIPCTLVWVIPCTLVWVIPCTLVWVIPCTLVWVTWSPWETQTTLGSL